MQTVLLALAAFTTLLSPSAAKANCPLYGPLLPRPTNLLQDPGIKGVASILDGVVAKYIDNDNSTGSERFSYVVEAFAGSEDKPLWSHYWTAPNLKTFNSSGVAKVDTNTVFRVGSVTKIFTVLSFLATVGDGIWNDPITKHLPEIQEIANNASRSPIYTTDWESITIGSLASQMSGLIRDCKPQTPFQCHSTHNSRRPVGRAQLPGQHDRLVRHGFPSSAQHIISSLWDIPNLRQRAALCGPRQTSAVFCAIHDTCLLGPWLCAAVVCG